MRSRQDGRRCGCISPSRPEEGFGIPLRNPTFPLLLDRVPLATWLDPPDELARGAFPKSACSLLDQSHKSDTIHRKDARRLFPLLPRPNSPYGYASATATYAPPPRAALPPPVCAR